MVDDYALDMAVRCWALTNRLDLPPRLWRARKRMWRRGEISGQDREDIRRLYAQMKGRIWWPVLIL